MTLEEILALLADPAGLEPEQLAEAETQLRALYTETREGELTEDAINTLQSIADAIGVTEAEATRRAAEADELARRAAELDARVLASEGEGDEDEAGPDAAEGDDEGAEAEPETETTEVEVEVEKPVAVAASTRPAPAPLEQIAQRQARPDARKRSTRARAFALADVPGVPAGGEIRDKTTLGQALLDRFESFRGTNGDGKIPVMRVKGSYTADRTLSHSDNAETTTRRIKDVAGLDAIVAAGGICAPTPAYYQMTVLSQAERPVRDALVGFQADRGGIRFDPSPKLTDIGTTGGSPNQAIDQYTVAEMEADTTKVYQEFSCPAEQEAFIYAVTKTVRFGVLEARTGPERVAALTDLTSAAHARYAENLLLTAIGTGSTSVHTADRLGASRDILNHVNLAAAGYRSRHRMSPNTPLRVMLPYWVVNAIQDDVWSAAFAATGPTAAPEVNEATIRRWFQARNINVTFFHDGVGTGQIFGAQSTGALNGYAATLVWYMFHEGAWLFLDGGTLDLGLMRDSALVAKNKFQLFMETFEGTAFVGVESLKITTNLCVNGASAGTIDPSTICDAS